MIQQTPVGKQMYSLSPMDLEGYDSLAELALDMRWSWNHATDEVWRQLDPTLWETLAEVEILRQYFRELKIHIINVVNLMTLHPQSEHSHGLRERNVEKEKAVERKDVCVRIKLTLDQREQT
jgi:hypothetical protein